MLLYFVYYAVNHISWILLHFLLWLLALKLVAMRFDKTKLKWNPSKRAISETLLHWVIS